MGLFAKLIGGKNLFSLSTGDGNPRDFVALFARQPSVNPVGTGTTMQVGKMQPLGDIAGMGVTFKSPPTNTQPSTVQGQVIATQATMDGSGQIAFGEYLVDLGTGNVYGGEG